VLVTAHHVARGAAVDVASAPRLVAESRDGGRHRVVAVRGDAAEHDLVALEIEGAEELPTLRPAEATPDVGAPVVLVGYGEGRRSVVPGRVATQDWEGDPELESYFHATCPVTGGHSGSPVFDAQGRVVGIAARGDALGVMAERVAYDIPLCGAQARPWDACCGAERARDEEHAAKQPDQAANESSERSAATAVH